MPGSGVGDDEDPPVGGGENDKDKEDKVS